MVLGKGLPFNLFGSQAFGGGSGGKVASESESVGSESVSVVSGGSSLRGRTHWYWVKDQTNSRAL